ncbi:30S ribosomal protein S19e [Candidatus Woesearchaeota archaeon]|nr:30S ribosomal protein S19e [Candidatus Woesearchaeota archaeon]
MTIYDVDATELIEALAKELQKLEAVKEPAWAHFVKTGAHKERIPARDDWWYVRAASVLRKVRLKGPIGVSKLRVLYGGKKNMGYAPERFKKGSGNIIRKILQQLEKAELIKKEKKNVHKGRIITPKGIKLMDNTATKIAGPRPAEGQKAQKKADAAKPAEKQDSAEKKDSLRHAEKKAGSADNKPSAPKPGEDKKDKKNG